MFLFFRAEAGVSGVRCLGGDDVDRLGGRAVTERITAQIRREGFNDKLAKFCEIFKTINDSCPDCRLNFLQLLVTGIMLK